MRIIIVNYKKNKNWLQLLFFVKSIFQNSKYRSFIRKFNAEKLIVRCAMLTASFIWVYVWIRIIMLKTSRRVTHDACTLCSDLELY